MNRTDKIIHKLKKAEVYDGRQPIRYKGVIVAEERRPTNYRGMGDIAIDGIALGIDAGTEVIESPARAQRTKVILRVVAAYTKDYSGKAPKAWTYDLGEEQN